MRDSRNQNPILITFFVIYLKGFAWDGRWAAWHETGPNTIKACSTKPRDGPRCVRVTSPQAVGNAFALFKDRLFVVTALGGLSLIIHDLRSPSSSVVLLADMVQWENVETTFCRVLEGEDDKCVVALLMKSGEIRISAVDVKSGALSQSYRIGE